MERLRARFEQNVPSVILHSEPFYKAEFLEDLIGLEEMPVMVIDTDLMYSGYAESGMVPKRDNVTVFCPDAGSWDAMISEIIGIASVERCTVIVDSLNGIHGMYEDIDSARFVDSCLMLLSSLARQSGSIVVITAMARRRDGRWAISPGGKQVLRSEGSWLYYLERPGRNLA